MGSRRTYSQVGISCVLNSPSRISLTVIKLGKISLGLCPQPLCPFCRAKLNASCCGEKQSFIFRNLLQSVSFVFIFLLLKVHFWDRESISWTWEDITTSSLNYFFSCSPCKKILLFVCNRNILRPEQPCEPPSKHKSWLKFYPAAAAANFLGLHAGTTTPSALTLTTTCITPRERQVFNWLALAGDSWSEPGQEQQRNLPKLCREGIQGSGRLSVETLWTVKFYKKA